MKINKSIQPLNLKLKKYPVYLVKGLLERSLEAQSQISRISSETSQSMDVDQSSLQASQNKTDVETLKEHILVLSKSLDLMIKIAVNDSTGEFKSKLLDNVGVVLQECQDFRYLVYLSKDLEKKSLN